MNATKAFTDSDRTYKTLTLQKYNSRFQIKRNGLKSERYHIFNSIGNLQTLILIFGVEILDFVTTQFLREYH